MYREIGSRTLHVTTASNVGTDSVALEFRVHADDREPLLLVEQFGDFGSQDLRLRTFGDLESSFLRAVIDFAKGEHGVTDSWGAELHRPFGVVETLLRESRDPHRPGLEFVDSTSGEVLVTVWNVAVPDDPIVNARVWQEIDLGSFEAMAAYAEEHLAGAGPAG